jgi:hypothetical protein
VSDFEHRVVSNTVEEIDATCEPPREEGVVGKTEKDWKKHGGWSKSVKLRPGVSFEGRELVNPLSVRFCFATRKWVRAGARPKEGKCLWCGTDAKCTCTIIQDARAGRQYLEKREVGQQIVKVNAKLRDEKTTAMEQRLSVTDSQGRTGADRREKGLDFVLDVQSDATSALAPLSQGSLRSSASPPSKRGRDEQGGEGGEGGEGGQAAPPTKSARGEEREADDWPAGYDRRNVA